MVMKPPYIVKADGSIDDHVSRNFLVYNKGEVKNFRYVAGAEIHLVAVSDAFLYYTTYPGHSELFRLLMRQAWHGLSVRVISETAEARMMLIDFRSKLLVPDPIYSEMYYTSASVALAEGLMSRFLAKV